MLSAVWVEFITSCGASKHPLFLLLRHQWSVANGSSIYPHGKHHMLHKFFLIFLISNALKDVAKGKVTQPKQSNTMHNMLMQPDCLLIILGG
jgi:hypothetical protein